MSDSSDPAGVSNVKDRVYDKIDEVLDDHGLVKRKSGRDRGVEEFDEETGFWESGVLNKPPRWLFRLSEEDDGWVAEMPDRDSSDRLGYYNVRVDNVAAGAARIVPIVREDDEWVLCQDWEWLCMVFFSQALRRGSSAETIEGFTPPDFTLSYQDEQLNPLAIQVFSLCTPNSTCSEVSGDLTYEEATGALRRLFGVETTHEDSSSDEEEAVAEAPSQDN